MSEKLDVSKLTINDVESLTAADLIGLSDDETAAVMKMVEMYNRTRTAETAERAPKRETYEGGRRGIMPNRSQGAPSSFPGVKRDSPEERFLHSVHRLAVGETCERSLATVEPKSVFAGLHYQALHWREASGGGGQFSDGKARTYVFRRGQKSTNGKRYEPAELHATIDTGDGRLRIRRTS